MNEDEALSRIYDAITRDMNSIDPLAKEILGEVADKLLPLWQVPVEVASTPGKIGALLPFNYVIPDQDLKLVEAVYSFFTATAGVSYFVTV